MNSKIKVIAFYLPQFHPIPENDEWWGKGFTEWTNVARAKPYYKNHDQPKIPADLGFYDLRVPETRFAQAELAKEAGVTAFCYWHYWFGDGKQLLEKPLQEVIRLGEPDFPFMLGWANHTWISKSWNAHQSSAIPSVLIEQKYPGEQDIINHFNRMLPVFKDNRYLRIHNKLPFLIYKIEDLPDFGLFKTTWNRLAQENGLPEFFFISHTESDEKLKMKVYQDTDAVCLCRINPRDMKRQSSRFIRGLRYLKSKIFHHPANLFDYSDVIKMMDTPIFEEERIFPSIVPNWDQSPRRGISALIYMNSTPRLFYKHIKMIMRRISMKKDEDKIIFLKSWNEWAEGNYMEPDLKYGKEYIYALKQAIDE